MLCSHDTMEVRLEYTTTEDVHCITEVAYGVPRNRLEIDISLLACVPAVVDITYLDVLPFVGARWHDLQTAQSIMQEGLVLHVSLCRYVSSRKWD